MTDLAKLAQLAEQHSSSYATPHTAPVPPEPTLKWCNACGEGVTNFCRGKSADCPMFATPPTAPVPEEPAEWKNAVLEQLAAHSMDAPLDEPPESILKRIIDMAVQMATDPAISAQPQQAEPGGWHVFNSGAEVASGLSFTEAMEYLTPSRLERGWTAVCVVDKDSPFAANSCAPAEPVLTDVWVSVDERLPPSGQTVLAFYLNSAGNERRVRAQWVAAKSCESGGESDIGEYDEATDTYYDPEGWYEQIDNWDVYSAVGICGVAVTHWMHLPPPPKEPASADQASQLMQDQMAWGMSIAQGGKRINPAEVFKPAVVPFEFKRPDDSEGGLP